MIFTPDDIHNRLRERPFTPLRLVTSTGQVYDIFHSDLVLIARRFLIVGTPSQENPSQADQVTRVALVQKTELRDLPPVAPPSTNGPAA
jgi:hypothetical protein